MTWEEAPVKMRRNPADPTSEERARHDATHLPFRPWCPVCVEAWATEDPHYRTTAEEQAKGKARICVDYCEIGEDLADKTDKQEVLVARDKWSKMMHASVAECKGNEDTFIAKQLSNFIMSTGYYEFELKTDGEPVLVAVAKRIKEINKVNIILKNPAAYDPQSNGMAERAVRDFKEQLRAVKIALEIQIKTKIGKRPYYRLHGKNFIGTVMKFGDMVHAKPLMKQARKRSFRIKTVMGIWLGILLRTGEHGVALLGGAPVIRVRTVIRVPDSEKWKADEIASVRATPKKRNSLNEAQTETKTLRETKGFDIGGDGSKLPETLVQESAEMRSRNFRITQDILDAFGYTEGCLGCEARSYGTDHRSHSAACRARLENNMIEDEKLKQMIYRRDARIKKNKHEDAMDNFLEEAPQAPDATKTNADDVDGGELLPFMQESDGDDTPKRTVDSESSDDGDEDEDMEELTKEDDHNEPVLEPINKKQRL